VDTKKKELIGNFKNAGRAWKEQAEEVNAHDFPQDALGKAVPYGIYDVLRNCGAVYVGSSADTPEFAVAALARWWEEEGQVAYPGAKQILILADSGESLGCRPRMWKQQGPRALLRSLWHNHCHCSLPNRLLQMESY
jgi:Rhodopirellula transposase DDE domain